MKARTGIIVLILVAFGAMATPVLALAQTAPVAAVPDPSQDIGGFASLVLRLVSEKAWLPLLAVGLVGLIALLRLLGGAWAPLGSALKSKLGGYVLNFAASAAVTFAGMALGGVPITLTSVLSILGTAAAASGLWEGLKDLFASSSPAAGS